MGPTQSKLFTKIPAMVTAGKTVAAELIALSDAAIAALAAANADPAAAAAAEQAVVDAYLALTANKLKAIATQRGLTVANGDVKADLTAAIIADGGDGTVSTAEQSAIDAYTTYLALDTAALQAEADGRNPVVVFGVDDDTDEEKARALVVADAF